MAENFLTGAVLVDLPFHEPLLVERDTHVEEEIVLLGQGGSGSLAHHPFGRYVDDRAACHAARLQGESQTQGGVIF